MTTRRFGAWQHQALVAALVAWSLEATCRSPTDEAASPGLLGQVPPSSGAIPFAPAVLSAGIHPHGSLAFSPDSRTVVWSAFLGDGPGQTLYLSTFDGTTLAPPMRMPFAADSGSGGPAFSSDGTKLFFGSRRPYPGPGDARMYGVWYVERTSTGWSDPVAVVATLDSLRAVGQVSIARSGNLYFEGRRPNEVPRLHRAEFANGRYQVPVLLAGPINRADAVDPFVDPDERFLVFAALWRGDSRGSTDLYISYKGADGTWGEPVQLGQQVNTAGLERFPAVSRDGRYLLFVRAHGDYPGDGTHYYWIASARSGVPSARAGPRGQE